MPVKNKKSTQSVIQLEGVVSDILGNGLFKVCVLVGDTSNFLNCRCSGKMSNNRIKILQGDRVMIEASPYDLTKGRITYRHK